MAIVWEGGSKTSAVVAMEMVRSAAGSIQKWGSKWKEVQCKRNQCTRKSFHLRCGLYERVPEKKRREMLRIVLHLL